MINWAKEYIKRHKDYFQDYVNSTPLNDYFNRMTRYPTAYGEDLTTIFYLDLIYRMGVRRPYVICFVGEQGEGKSSLAISIHAFIQKVMLRTFDLKHLFDNETTMLNHALKEEEHPKISSFHLDEVDERRTGYDILGELTARANTYARIRAKEFWITKASVDLKEVVSPYSLLPFSSIRNPEHFEQQLLISAKVYRKSYFSNQKILIGYINFPVKLDLVARYFKTSKANIISNKHLIDSQSVYKKTYDKIAKELLKNEEFQNIPEKMKRSRRMYINKKYKGYLFSKTAAWDIAELVRYLKLTGKTEL